MARHRVPSNILPFAAALALTGAMALATSAEAAQTIRTDPGVSHTMPDGAGPDVAAAASAAPNASHATGIPIGGEALEKIKAEADGAPAGAAATDELGKTGPTPKVLLKNCDAQSANGFAPSDSHGAAGPTNVVTVSNTIVQVQSKSSCGIVSSQTLATFFGPTGVASSTTLFDPRVVYDKAHNRFFLTAESERSSSTDQYQYFAISKDSLGTTWWLYKLRLSDSTGVFCKQAANSFWDYPSAGYSNARWFITANDFPATGGTIGKLLDINLAPTLTGGSTVIKCFGGLPFNLAPPLVRDTATVATFLSPGSGSGSTIQRRNLNQSTTSPPTNDTVTTIANVNIAAWTAPPNAAQPNGTTLDTLDGRFQSASIQSRGLLWNVHAVSRSTASGSRSTARVYKLSQSSTSTTPSMTLSLFTAGSDNHIFNPSFATGSGAFNAPAFVTTSRTIPTGVSGTGGNAAMLMFQGLNSSTNTSTDWYYQTLVTSATQFTGCSPCRWGDYSATQVDTNSLGTAWGWNQYFTGTSQFSWRERFGKVELYLTTAPTPAAAIDE